MRKPPYRGASILKNRWGRSPIDLPDVVEAITFRMEHAGLSAKDLQPIP